jgi:hypothetical protein
MCANIEQLTLFSMWYDYIMTVWGGGVSLYPFHGGQSAFFFQVTDTIYCTQGEAV